MMKSAEISSVAIIGSGKVANALTSIFIDKNVQVSGIASRNFQSGKLLSNKCNCAFFENQTELVADLILVCIHDDSVKSSIEGLNPNQQVAYTAGSVNLQEINHPNCSVFYPLQTFTTDKKLTSEEIPILIESKNKESISALENLCLKIGFSYQLCDSNQRKQYHLAAVFMNNFVNHLVYLSKKQVTEEGLNWELMQPLLKETCYKLFNIDLCEGQTGPARRKDLVVIESQQKMLDQNQLEIYKAITKSIIETYKND